MSGNEFSAEPSHSIATERSQVGSPERLDFYKDHNFYILHGNFQSEVPTWAKQFRQFLTEKGAPEDNIHVPHLKHLLANYGSWRKDSKLPRRSEDSKKAIVIAHSSGAEMALVYAEHHKVSGMILLAPTDRANTGGIVGTLLSPFEKASGMYIKSKPRKNIIFRRMKREFKWDRIVSNCGFIVVVHATGDIRLVPEIYSKNVYDKLKEASRKLLDSETEEKGAEVVYVSVVGNGHNPEMRQFAQIISQISPLSLK